MPNPNQSAESPLIKSAMAFHKKGDIKHALPLYQEALIDYPNNAILLSNYGSALLSCYDLEMAKFILVRAVEIDPNLADAWSNLGNLYQLSQDYGYAIEAYQKCLSLQSDHPGL